MGALDFPIWGTTARLLVTDPKRLDVARAALDAELAAMGAACDRFRTDSELSRLNAAAGRPVEVSPLFARTLERALEVAEATDGAVDPTVGAALVAAGYDRDITELRHGGPAPRLVRRRVAGWRTVRLDGHVVRLPRGVRLDLGATAKALAADRAAARAFAETGCGILVGLGGDIAVGGPPPEGGWRIRVTDDHRDDGSDASGQDVVITAGGLATSSVTVRRWRRGDQWLHHIIDPATGIPAASCWRTVSVAAATCVDANAAATAALVKGWSARTWLGDLRLPARLVRLDGRAFALAGWPEDALTVMDDPRQAAGPGQTTGPGQTAGPGRTTDPGQTAGPEPTAGPGPTADLGRTAGVPADARPAGRRAG
ncbi:FAD:protein FMN transferase [Actinoallomurus soli]|uniref:FAD:protein FMN transferase n=1 Tax=Actinoallomurus soli TaxID=2952535 RepID=UPI002092D6A3|nr:FAD:protein FMN transferase [Actinoallomurus soli]MCO5968649.1 FAD:protein FMN transferase [Actinoallomurus soli]